MDLATKHAIRHTVHCLVGCGIGEVVGMLIAAGLGWGRLGRVALALTLAFAFGYYLTYRGVRKSVGTSWEAIRITAATDTVSIATMELVDNTMELLIPNALMVMPNSPRFWWGLAVSLAVAFVITVPVNRWMMLRNAEHNHAHMH
jgi:hypothetical protein